MRCAQKFCTGRPHPGLPPKGAGVDGALRAKIMNDVIFETVVTTVAVDGTPHVAPMGVRYLDDRVVLMPFKPSTTFENITATGHAVLNLLTDISYGYLDPRIRASD